MPVKGGATQAERSEATRAALVSVARRLFAERGYAGVGTEEIVREARVTRGALYHHFADKRDLFRAVHEGLEEEVTAGLARRIGEFAESGGDALGALMTGVDAFLEVCMDPAVARITLMDAPVVLGWEEWREIDARYGLGIVTAGLQAAMDQGLLRRSAVTPLAHVLLGALGEAAMMIANAKDKQTTRDDVRQALVEVLQGLRS